MLPFLLLALLVGPVRRDSTHIVGSTLIMDEAGLQLELPPAWFNAVDTARQFVNCGHERRGALNRRLATSRPFLDSLRNAKGEWDREYSSVTDSILPFAALVAQIGPEPFGSGNCFGDLQVRVYIGQAPTVRIGKRVALGVQTAQAFFPSAALASRDSMQWHIDRLHWDAWYGDYGAEANVEIYSTIMRGREVALVFMHTALPGGPAAEDQQFILDHLRHQ